MIFCFTATVSFNFQVNTKNFNKIHFHLLKYKKVMKILLYSILNNYVFKYSILHFIAMKF